MIDFSFFKRAFILLLAVCLFCVVAPHRAEAAIAFDATSNAQATSTSSLSWQHTVGTGGSNRILVVGVSWRNSGPGTQTVSGVTYNSQALTLIRKDEKFDSESRSTAMYYLKNPPTGSAYNIVVSFSGGDFYKCVGGAISLTGVDQTNPVDAHNGVAGGVNSPASVTVTTNTDGAWVLDTVIVRNPTATTTVGAGQTQRWNRNMTDVHGAGSHEGPKTPAGNVTMSWTIGTNDPYSISAAAFKPASSNAAPNTPTIDNYNTGACTSDTTPSLQFDLSDPDSGDIVKYQVQIDDEATFASPYVDDTTEGSGSAEPRSNVLHTPSTLSQDAYYWRVKAIDDDAAESAWATANSGAIAFYVDTANPTAPGNLTESVKTSSSITLNFGAQSTEANFDTYKIFYKQGASGVTESDTEHTDSNLGYIDYNSTTTTTINGLSADTQYVFNIWAYDVCGNKTAATEVAITTNAPSTTQAIKIQRGTADVPNTGTTQTAPADFIEFGSLTSAFVLNKNNQFGSAGASTADSNDKSHDDTSLRIELTATDTITFSREAASDNQDYRADWESWEYIGSAGGPNEFIVRSRNTVTLLNSERTKTATLDNTPYDIDRCIPFITGISSDADNYRAPDVTAIAWLSGTNTLNVERGGDTNTTIVQIVTVEFTGSNWRVAHGLNSGYTADTGTINLVEEAAGTGTAFTINATDNAFVAATQHRSTEVSTNAPRVADSYPTTYISSATQVSFAHHTDHSEIANQKLMVHVLENAGVSVWRTTDTQFSDGDNNVDISAAGVTDLSNTAVFATGATAGTGTSNPKGRRNYRLTSTTNLAHWCTRSGNSEFEHRIEVVSLPMDSNWYSDSCWQYRKKLTIDAGLVEADLTDFPVLISFTGDSDLAAGAQSDFDDVLFTSADGTTKLSHEIEDYDSTNGDIVAWVKIPFLSSSSDTEIFMYYGCGTASNQQNAADVWSNGFVGVWHMSDNTSNTTVIDSTGQINGALNENTNLHDIAGHIAGALNFDGSDDNVNISGFTSSNFDYLTISCWVKLGSQSQWATIFGKSNTDFGEGFGLRRADTDDYVFVTSTTGGGKQEGEWWTTSDDDIAEGTWEYVVGTYDGSANRLYVDGSVAMTDSDASGSIDNTTNTLHVADQLSGDDAHLNGVVDEVRVSTIARSANWIKTEHNNQNNPGTGSGKFIKTVSGEETSPYCDYAYKRAIIIDGDEVGGSSGYLTDFPMLVNLSDTWLKKAPDGDIQHASGWDIIFRGLDATTCNGTAPCDLDFEIETYDGSTGKLVAWVRVPQVYAGDNDPDNDSVIYMYYGSSCVADDPQNATGVWDSNYKGVWHLAEKYGLDFDGADDYVDTGYNIHHTQTTIEAWISSPGLG